MRTRQRGGWLGGLVILIAVSAVVARVDAQAAGAVVANDVLTIGGDVPSIATFTTATLRTMPRSRVKVQEDGRDVVCEGVLLSEILKRAGAPTGSELRGNNLASYLLATARDGYQVVFSLPEVDPGFTKSEAIVADTVDGKALFDYQGPLRIIVPHDSRPARSVRMLQRIDIVKLRK